MRLFPALSILSLSAMILPSLALAQGSEAASRAADADLAPVRTVDPAATAASGNTTASTTSRTTAAPAYGNGAYAQPAQGQAASQGYPSQAGQTQTAPAERSATQQQAAASAAGTSPSSQTYSQEDVLAKAENVFGKGAEGLASLIQNIFKDNGEPNGYIVGREAGGALAIGLRYGSGTLFHKVEGERPIYWTGPSLGFDIGADASKVFTLVYHLYDTEDLYERFPQVEGKVYFVGGFTATYLQRDDVILVPVKLGVGWRLGANVGYMKFSKKSKILPF